MVRLHFVAALVLAFTLAVPGALAATVEGNLVTSSLQAVGPSSLDGHVTALFRVRETPLDEELLDPLLNQTEPEELPPAAFTLQASRLRVEVDTADPVVHSPATWHLLPETYSTTRSDHTNAMVLGQNNREGYRSYLFALPDSPLPNVHAESSCSNLEASSSKPVSSAPRAQDQTQRPATTASADTAMVWTDCSGVSRLTITGDFMLSLWEWDASIEADGKAWDAPSGSMQSEKVPVQGQAVATRDQEVYLYAYDATLTIPVLGPTHKLYLSADPAVQADSVILSDVRGNLRAGDEVQEVEGASLALQGNLDITAAGRMAVRYFAVTLAGDLTSAQVDGQPLSLPSASTSVTSGVSPNGIPLLWPLLGLVGLVGVPSAVLVPRRVRAARRHRVEALIDICDRLFERSAFTEMRAMALKAVALAPKDPEAHVQVARALEQVGLVDAAQMHRDTADSLLRSRGDAGRLAENALQAAHAAAENLFEPVALRWIRVALRADPAVRDEMVQVPSLERLVDFLESPPPEQPFWLQP